MVCRTMAFIELSGKSQLTTHSMKAPAVSTLLRPDPTLVTIPRWVRVFSGQDSLTTLPIWGTHIEDRFNPFCARLLHCLVPDIPLSASCFPHEDLPNLPCRCFCNLTPSFKQQLPKRELCVHSDWHCKAIKSKRMRLLCRMSSPLQKKKYSGAELNLSL